MKHCEQHRPDGLLRRVCSSSLVVPAVLLRRPRPPLPSRLQHLTLSGVLCTYHPDELASLATLTPTLQHLVINMMAIATSSQAIPRPEASEEYLTSWTSALRQLTALQHLEWRCNVSPRYGEHALRQTGDHTAMQSLADALAQLHGLTHLHVEHNAHSSSAAAVLGPALGCLSCLTTL